MSIFAGMNLSDKIYSGDDGWSHLQVLIREYRNPGIFILVDENTVSHCLPVLMTKCAGLEEAKVIEIKSGEANKTIAGVENVWQMLSSGRAMRNSLLICLGGGVITDIGGFAAATFKRGMDFIHLPTTLLAMVDASLGGKTGINLHSVKNQVGVFAQAKSVFIFTEFLATLPARQKLSGFAEMLKHALIDSRQHFEDLMALDSPEQACTELMILRSAAVKIQVVNQDPSEGGIRKVLNFGHTIGHAVEAYSQQNDAEPLSHGEAVAIGLVCESLISVSLLGMDENDFSLLTELVVRHYPHYSLPARSADELLVLMGHDKKNTDSSRLNFSLISNIGEPVYDQLPGEKLIRESLHYYVNL
ncbi:MAG: 3-dehydroquinate synthase [Bacteroidota bacterium]